MTTEPLRCVVGTIITRGRLALGELFVRLGFWRWAGRVTVTLGEEAQAERAPWYDAGGPKALRAWYARTAGPPAALVLVAAREEEAE